MSRRTAAFAAAAVLAAFLAGRLYEQGAKPARASGKVIRYRDPMHPWFTSDRPGIAPDCGMPLVSYRVDEPAPLAGVPRQGLSLSPELRQLLGVRMAVVSEASGVRRFRTVGRVTADDALVYRVNAGTDGWIRQVYPVATGDLVRKDQPLATFYSREFIAAQQAYFYALESRDRERTSVSTPEQSALIEAQVEQAREALEALGMGVAQLQEIARTRRAAREIVLRSPVGGVLLAKNAVLDQRFEKYSELYRVGDLSRVWIIADLFERDARFIHPGQTASVSVPANGQTLTAIVGALVPPPDGSERNLMLRLQTENPGLALRVGMLADVEVSLSLRATKAVPVDAVLDTGGKKLVFVGRGDSYFEPREVETGWISDDFVQVTRGLQAGEKVAVGANFLLDSETKLRLSHDKARQ